MAATACIGIDLDELVHYARIHGLPEGPYLEGRDVHRIAGERFGELMARHDLVGTAFVIGESVQGESRGAEAARRALRYLVQAGHEIGNHTFSHDYSLTTRARAMIDTEIQRAGRAIARITGERPVGFRAPGYNVDTPIFESLAAQGYVYDSSIFPSGLYYGARAAIIAAMRLVGRRSSSMPGRPQQLLAPLSPYRPDPKTFWRHGEGKVVELPIAVVPRTGIPFIGTAIAALPWPSVLAAYRVMRGQPFLNLELHGIDLMDATDVPPPLVRAQPDLRVPLREKMRRFDALLGRIAEDFDVQTLAAAARAPGISSVVNGSRV